VLLSARAFSFGEFRLLPEERMLLAAGQPVHVSSRALDILTVLVNHPGELLTKGQLIARAWPNTRVEENNLRVHIGALRKLLGECAAGVSYIATVPGRGYFFVGHVAEENLPSLLASVPPPINPRPLPAPITRMIGRQETLESFLSRMRTERLVTIVGPGGIGKTTLALAMAERLRGSFEHQAIFVDLSPLADSQLLASALASALGVATRSECALNGLITFMAEKRMLVVLDSCEHLVEPVATMTEALLKGASGVRVLATSREPLGVEGEWVEHLQPLGLPESAVGLTSAKALTFPALQLFVERAAASVEGFRLSDKDVPTAVEICQKLDGIPLAIELAAARVVAFGISGLAARLNDQLAVLTRGRRTAPPRHKTLRAMLDWSYCVLSEQEQVVLRRVAIFSGEFTLESASVVAGDSGLPGDEVPERVADLAAKSLLVTVPRDDSVNYRMLDTTHSYAREKLLQSPEFEAVSRLRAKNCCRYLSAMRAGSDHTAVGAERIANYRRIVDDVRAALGWCFSADGEVALGVTLTALAVPVFMHLSLFHEHYRHVERALKAAAGIPKVDALSELSLNLSFGRLLTSRAKATAEITNVFDRALQIAERLDSWSHLVEALVAAWWGSIRCADYPRALDLAERLRVNTERSSDQSLPLEYLRTMLVPLHYMGHFAKAQHFIEDGLERLRTRADTTDHYAFHVDTEVMLQAFLARNLWLQGFPDKAAAAATRGLARALSIQNVAGVTHLLIVAACPVAIWRGDAQETHPLSLLDQYAMQFSVGWWRSSAALFKRVLSGAANPDAGDLDAMQVDAIPTFCEDLVPDEALARVDEGRVGWNAAEVVRVSGEQLLRNRGAAAAESAEKAFLRSLQIARAQGALSWELRTATSLGRLWGDQHRTQEARELLASVYGRFREGFRTKDYLRAGALLQELSTSR
jgi:predicted ATPase/DNA-binding winged helix-turn-helix (wHTH) protein